MAQRRNDRGFHLKATVAALGLSLSASQAIAHNSLSLSEVRAGYREDMEILVTHGCGMSPVVEFRLQIPKVITVARPHNDPDWDIEMRMRKLDEPIPGKMGRMVTEVVEEIIWKNPKRAPLAMNMVQAFKVRLGVPKAPGAVIHLQSTNVCANGEREAYVDLPTEALNLEDPEFVTKASAFMSATPTPAPFMVVRPAEKSQYPWEWKPDQVLN